MIAATVDSRRRSFRWTRSPHPASGRISRTRPAFCRAGVTVPAFLSTATHGHRRKAQVFRPRYAVPKASNSKLNAAIQAGSTRCDIPTKMAQKHKTGHRKIMDSPAPLDG
jgi:hypothetical protein